MHSCADSAKTHSVLIVDDDPDIVEIIALYLTNAGYRTDTAAGSGEALAKLQAAAFDLLILDIMLPDCDGVGLCAKLRPKLACPILFISCLDDEAHILAALRAGGDDYIRKPFSPRELVARVEASLRRAERERAAARPSVPASLQVRDLAIDAGRRTVRKSGRLLDLSPIEFELLLCLAAHPNQPLEYGQIYEQVWRSSSLNDTRTVLVHVSNLRKKLEEEGGGPYIKTLKRRGYMFIA